MCKSIWNTNCIVCLHPCHFATNRKGLHELLRHLLVREEEHRLELFSLLLARLATAPSLHHHLLVLAPVCPSLPPQRLQATRSPGSDNATASSRCMPAQYALNHASSSCCACCACSSGSRHASGASTGCCGPSRSGDACCPRGACCPYGAGDARSCCGRRERGRAGPAGGEV